MPLVSFVSKHTVHQHYEHQSNQATLSYNSYAGLPPQSSGGGAADMDQLPSGTPSASVHSSPGHHQGKLISFIFTLLSTNGMV